ncbi:MULTISPECIES: SAM-dependent methyltransferase [Streptomyces]|uniref:SAM-dependent methyltransferase n=1 Tax=Streptomyces eurythermus TaxID=42237 RepID=A0ABW6Z5K9_9ACTN|nr:MULTISPECIES: SAM-dependent methyltransferase [Streptomyces]
MDGVDKKAGSSDEGARDLGQDRPHSARMYDYYLGGKTNYAVDREAAQAVIQQFPAIVTTARINRAYMQRAVHFLAAERGVRQFLDIGTGIPTAPNLHEVVQAVDPRCKVAYVDTDPIVLAYADSLLTSAPQGETSYIEASVTSPEAVIDAVREDGCISFDKPVALTLHALLHFVPDDQDAYGVVERLLDALPTGSYLSLSHCTGDFAPEPWQAIVDLYTQNGTPAQVRSYAEVLRFFDRLDPVDPGLVVAHRWRPTPASGPSLATDADASLYAGVALKR